jgi:hypothetical protein
MLASHADTPAPPAAPPASPTPHELVAAPELPLLVALQQLLELTTRTLATIYPGLIDPHPWLRPLEPQAILAEHLIKLGALLASTATHYRVAVLASLHAPDDAEDIPF